MTETVKAILVDARCECDTAILNTEEGIRDLEQKLSSLTSHLDYLYRRRAEIQAALDGASESRASITINETMTT